MAGRKKKKEKGESIHPLLFLFFAASFGLCFIGVLMALIDCIDRTDELFNSLHYTSDWRTRTDIIYHNEWEPFRAGFLDCVRSIPRNLYIGFFYFPSAALVGLIFFPLLVVLLPAYEAFALTEFTMLVLGWVPFIAGIMLFTLTGLLCEMGRIEQKQKELADDVRL